MSGDALSLKMMDVKIKEARRYDLTYFMNGYDFSERLEQLERKQKINLNGSWYDK